MASINAPDKYDKNNESLFRGDVEKALTSLRQTVSSLQQTAGTTVPSGNVEFIINAVTGEVTARITPLANTNSFGVVVDNAAFDVDRTHQTLHDFVSETTPFDLSLGVRAPGDVRYVTLWFYRAVGGAGVRSPAAYGRRFDFTAEVGPASISTDKLASGAATIAKGGVGFTSYTTGDLIYASATNTLAKRAIGTSGQFLRESAGLPTWHTLVTADVTDLTTAATGITKVGTIGTGVWQATPVVTTYGGTGLASYTAGDTLYYASGTTLAKLAIGTAAQFLWVNAGATAPEWRTLVATDIGSPAALTRVDDTNVTLTLGGSPSTSLLRAASLTLGWSGTLGVARGGTNLGSYTAGDLLYATASTTLAKLAIGTAAQFLWVNAGATAPEWRTLVATDIGSPAALTRVDDTNVTLTLGGSPSTSLLRAASLTLGWSGTLGVARGGTNLGSYTAGDLLYATASTTLAKLAIGTTNHVLTSGGSAPQWSSSLTGINTTGSAATLTTTRTIWGQSFNGSANVSGSLTGVSTIDTSGTITIGVSGRLLLVSTAGTPTTTNADFGDIILNNQRALRVANAANSSAVHALSLDGSNQILIAASGNAVVFGSSALSGVTTLTIGGGFSGATTGSFSGAVDLGNLNPIRGGSDGHNLIYGSGIATIVANTAGNALSMDATAAIFNSLALSGITTLAGTGAVSGFTTASISGNFATSGGQITAGVTGTSGVQIVNDGTIGTIDAQTLKLRTSATTRVTIAAASGAVTFTGALSGITDLTASGIFSTTATGQVLVANSATTSSRYIQLSNTGGASQFAVESSTGGAVLTGSTAYATVLLSAAATALEFGTNTTTRLSISSAGAFNFKSNPVSGITTLDMTGAFGTTGNITITKISPQITYVDTNASKTWKTVVATGVFTIGEDGIGNYFTLAHTTGAATFASTVTLLNSDKVQWGDSSVFINRTGNILQLGAANYVAVLNPLDVTGSLTVSGVVTVGDGFAHKAGSMNLFYGDTSTGRSIFYIGTTDFHLRTQGGVERLTVTAAGAVSGITTLATSDNIQVSGASKRVIVGFSGSPAFRLEQGSGATDSAILEYYKAGNPVWQLGNNLSGSGTDQFFLQSQGFGNVMVVTYATGAVVWGGVAHSGITTLAGTGAISGFTSITLTGLVKTTLTTQQLALHYDASNHLAVTVSSAGAVTYNATGASAGHAFSNLVTANAGLTVASGQTITLTGVTVTGFSVTAANVSAGTFPSGTFVFQGTLALGANSLTMTGSLASTGSRVTKGWFTDLEVTNAIVSSGATFSGDVILTGTGSDVIVAATARFRFDGSASGDTYVREASANEILFVAGGVSVVSLSATELNLDAGAPIDLRFGRTAQVAAAVVSTHKIQVKDGSGTTYYLLATT